MLARLLLVLSGGGGGGEKIEVARKRYVDGDGDREKRRAFLRDSDRKTHNSEEGLDAEDNGTS